MSDRATVGALLEGGMLPSTRGMAPKLGAHQIRVKAVVFLASDEISFVVGSALVVDGGLLTRLATTRQVVGPGMERGPARRSRCWGRRRRVPGDLT